MAKTKAKEELSKSKKVSAQEIPMQGNREQFEIEMKRLKEAWNLEIETLKSKEYSSVEAAADELVELVINRLGDGFKNDPQMKDFLNILIQTDPSITTELQRVLSIK